MINYKVASIEIIQRLIEIISEFYSIEKLDPAVETTIGTLIDDIKEDSHFVIEYPYVDKLYRDSYYHFFSSKHREYSRDCIRVSVFLETINEQDLWDSSKREKLMESYRGFFIIRPTLPHVIGRSFLNKSVLIGCQFYTCETSLEISMNGVRLKTNGFPHSRQNRENTTCAETSLWVLMEYFSERYSYYKSVLPSEIINRLNQISDERLLPSQGLNASQVAYTLKEFGFGSKIYSKTSFDELNDIMLVYIESGIPFIAILDNQQGNYADEALAHAVVVCGKEHIDITNVEWVKGKDGNYHTEDIERRILIMDDNQGPYRLVDIKSPYKDYEDDSFHNFEFSAIIVPLYPKIYLEATQAKELAMSIVRDGDLGYAYSEGSVYRFLLSSGRSYKAHINSLNEIDQAVRALALATPMPKFVWILEIYESKEAIQEEEGKGFMVIDATEINNNISDALLIASYPDRTISYSDRKLVPWELNLGRYRLFPNNLS